jgi:putative transposase
MEQVKQAPGWPLHRPVHFYVQGGCYFVTAACLHHQPLLHAPERRTWFTEYLHCHMAEIRVELVAWVVLPNHYHLVVRVEESRTIPSLLQRLHACSALQFNREDVTPGRQVWWSYWDRCLWTEGDLWSRINYIHRNPVKHGYVAAPEEWAHSSWHRFTALDPSSEAGLAMQRFPAPRQLPHDP